MVPAFSVSASAINIDGYDVFTNVYDSQLGDYKEFENTLSLDVSTNQLRIIFDIHLPEVIKKNTLFDLEVDFNIGEFLSISEFNGGGTMYDKNWNQLDGSLPGIVQNGKLKDTQILAQGNVKYIRYVFEIYNPTWHIVNTPIVSPITDLTGTTWVFKDSWEIYGLQPNTLYYLNCVISTPVHSEDITYIVRGSGNSLYTSKSTYSQGSSFTLQIIDGKHVKDSTVINWIAGNAYPQGGNTQGGNTQAVQYTFDFAVTSVTVTQDEEETGIFAGIFGWVKKIFNAIIDLPNAIGKKLTEVGKWLVDQIKGLFIPSEESVIDLKNKFEALFADRFGAAYQSVEIVDQFGQAMGISTYADADPTITFPEVTVNLAGTPFTFGGWEVDLIPKGFEALLTPLRLIVDLVCTIALVNTFRRRMEGILG